MKPQPTEPVEGQWNWENADKIANFARANKIGLRGHCLVWHAQTPDWMFHDEKGNLVSKEVLFERMRKHIHTIVNRYKDVVYAWDVVNEAMTDDPKAEVPYRQSLYYKIAGDEFIKKAFEYAHEADPKALLFYNDYNETNPAKRDRIYNMVKSMKAEGIPISGIGMQGHYNTLSPTEDEFRKAIELYSQVVDNIHITELDVRINTREQGGQLSVNQDNRTLELTPEADEAQVAQYDMLFRVLRESFFALLSPVIILGCIYSGIASPTEAAVISVFYALFVSLFLYRTMKFRDIPPIFVEAIRTFTPILFILAASTAFSRVLTLMQVPQAVSNFILEHFNSPVMILLVINLFLLIVGMVMDTTPAILILTPILLPIVTAINMDPVQFGVIMVVNLAIGFVTPPIGVNLFVASSLTDVPIMAIAKKAMPMIGLFLVALLLITFIPALSLGLL